MNLKQLLGMCEHKWKLLRQEEIINALHPDMPARGILFILQCEKCGHIKSKREMV